MINGKSIKVENNKVTNVPCKDLETQAQEILNKNNYKYIDLIYKPHGRESNMRYATLIVDDKSDET